jgi:hypothetical protein
MSTSPPFDQSEAGERNKVKSSLNHDRSSASETGACDTPRAYFSPDRTFRYALMREIADPQFGCLEEDERGGTVTFVGLNPSTADETTDDPTIRRCMGFARRWGFDRLKMVNLYAYRATDPRHLWLANDPVGPENDHVLSLVFGGSEYVVAAWGAHARPERLEQFADTFDGWQFWALGLTKDGAPRHPLYMRGDSQPFVYDLRRRAA